MLCAVWVHVGVCSSLHIQSSSFHPSTMLYVRYVRYALYNFPPVPVKWGDKSSTFPKPSLYGLWKTALQRSFLFSFSSGYRMYMWLVMARDGRGRESSYGKLYGNKGKKPEEQLLLLYVSLYAAKWTGSLIFFPLEHPLEHVHGAVERTLESTSIRAVTYEMYTKLFEL